jgi:hypothetical protein
VSPAWHRPGVSRDLETICLKCLAKEPRDRYASAAAVADDRPILTRRVSRVLRRGPRRLAAIIAIVALLALGIFLFPYARSKFEKSAGATAPAVAPEKSIAVLPFENLSTNQENSFFADGVQDEILTNLAKVPI